MSRFSIFLICAFLVSRPLATQADPVKELASFSVFPTVDLALLKGEVKPMRGPAMGNPRFQSVQTCWVSSGAPAQVSAALRNFNPAKHSDLGVLVQGNGSNFSGLSSLPVNSAVQWLKDATEKKSTDLQISREEAAKAAAFVPFWTSILSARTAAGVFGQPSYDHTGKNVRAGEEVSALLAALPKIKKEFGGVIGGKGEQYWEVMVVDGKGAFSLGTTFSRAGANGAQQLADVLYYASNGLYAAVTLYQLWPVQVDGKAGTLVWRGDLISSAELADLHGVERLGAEAALLRDVGRSVRALRSEGGAR